MAMNPCPALEQLRRLLTEELSPPERSSVETHVEDCGACKLALEELTDDPSLRPADTSAEAPLLGLRHQQARGADARPGDAGRTTDFSGAAADEPLSLAFLAPAARPDSLGRLGHYEILEAVGRGAFGIVFRAFDDVLQRVVAIKVLAPELAATSPARRRFLREARAAGQVRHENIVQIYAVEEQPLPYLVMEFIPGETLQQRLDRTGPFDAEVVAAIGRQVADGLSAAHAAGLIHRDIKPANVLLEQGPRRRVKVTDFGLARAADDASLTQSGLVAGTPLYMSPEQAAGEVLDHRSDLFSLGSVLYAITAGHPPFRAGNTLAILKRVAEDAPRPIPEIIPETPAWLCAVIAKLMAKDPGARYQTAPEVADALAGARAPALPASPPARARPRVSRRGVVGALLACVAIIGLSVYGVTRPARDEDEPVADRASPMDALDRRAIPPQRLDPLGGERAAPEVVAVLGDRRGFVFPGESWDRFAAQMSPDGKWIAAPSGFDGNVQIFEVPSGRLLRTLHGPGGEGPARRIREVAISADGSVLAGATWSMGKGSRVRIWDRKTFEVLYTTPADAKAEDLGPLAFSPDGRWLVVGLLEPEVQSRVCEARTGKEVRMIPCPPWGTFSSDGKLYAGCAEKPEEVTLRVFETETWSERKTWTREAGQWDRVRFSPDDKLLVGGSRTRLNVWKTDTWESAGSFAISCPRPEFLRDGRTVLSMNLLDDEPVRPRVRTFVRWDVATGEQVGSFQVEGPPEALLDSLSPDRRNLIVVYHGTVPYHVRIFDPETGQERYLPTAHEGAFRSVTFSPDGKTLASAEQSGTVRLWDTATAQLRHTLTGHQGAATGVAFHPDGKTLASGGEDGTARLWDLATGAARVLGGHATGRLTVAFSADGGTLAAAGADGVRLWDPDAAKPRRLLQTRAAVWRTAFSPDGKWLAAGCDRGVLHLWDAATGQELSTPPALGREAVRDVTFHPTKPRLALTTPHAEGGIGLWAVDPFQEIQQLEGHRRLVRACRWGPGGRSLISAGEKDGTVRLWDLTGAEPRSRAISLGAVEITGAALSPDGSYLATANADGTIYLLRLVQAGEALRVP
jgi:eukaryotic-like serine/threonine-protein kinase